MSSNLTSPTISPAKTTPTEWISDCGIGRPAIFTLIVLNSLPKLRRDWIWLLIVAGTIILASSREVTAPKFTAWIPSFDKLAHFSVYGLLGTLTLKALRNTRNAAWLSIVAVSLFGASDEWHQSFVPGRSSTVADWVADTVGAALAVSLYVGWRRYRQLLETSLIRSKPTVERDQIDR